MTAAVSIEPVAYEQKSVLRRLLQFYLYDFTEFEPDEVRLNEHGEFDYRYLDHYWAPDPGEERYPLFIRADAELAGFALVRQVNDTWVMAEFFVMRAFRRGGVGTEAARQVFGRFAGSWLVHEVPQNVVAQAFWRRVIAQVARGGFEEEVTGDGVTQRFVTG